MFKKGCQAKIETQNPRIAGLAVSHWTFEYYLLLNKVNNLVIND